MAAVDYGADAVYIGGSKFGARRGACNPVEEVARAVEYAHQYGVRIHATLNTLLFDGELADAEAEARALIAAGVDAVGAVKGSPALERAYEMGRAVK